MLKQIVIGVLLSCISVDCYQVTQIDGPLVGDSVSTFWDCKTKNLYYSDYFGFGDSPVLFRYDFVRNVHFAARIQGYSSGQVGNLIPLNCAINQFLVSLGSCVAVVYWDGFSTTAIKLRERSCVDQGRIVTFAKVDPRQRLFVGSGEHTYCVAPEGSWLYRFAPLQGLVKSLSGVGVSGGMDWNVLTNQFYHRDVCQSSITEYQWSPLSGSLSNGRPIFQFSNPNAVGVGIEIDKFGMLYVAMYNDSSVVKINPRSSQIVETYVLPAKYPLSLTFCGPLLDTLCVTTGNVPLNVKTASVEDTLFIPNDGKLYKISGIATHGYCDHKTCLNYSLIDATDLAEDFASSNLSDMYHSSDVNRMLEIFNGVVVQLLNKHAPLIPFVSRDRIDSSVPWYTSEIDMAIAKRNYTSLWSTENLAQMKKLRNRRKQLISNAKRAFLSPRLYVGLGMKNDCYQVTQIDGPSVGDSVSTFWDCITKNLYYSDFFAFGDSPVLFRYDFVRNVHFAARIQGYSSGQVGNLIPLNCAINQFLVSLGSCVAVVYWDGFSTTAIKLRERSCVDQGRIVTFAKVDPRQRLFVGSGEPTYCVAPEGSWLYRFAPLQGLVKSLSGVGVSGGMDWNVLTNQFYHKDVCQSTITEYQWSPLSGSLSNGRPIFQFSNPNAVGVGIEIDKFGMLYVAMYNDSSVVKINPRSSQIVETYVLPAKHPLSLTFCGPLLDTLCVTTGNVPLNVKTASVEDTLFTPNDGKLYKISGIATHGYCDHKTCL
ncbi:putative sugar lactone lactonase YvrE [Pseudolycoriella hygida]|uniref:Sugar lactone lactonase YvrE n=1 Tax=Pseudolycoriella hygida TaxID=35572 RepID=A0A9Q0MQS7_9DIPT|nr:putative sugar lactone lactonase YvrE [Pseudolycoriella hygida]